MCLKIQTKPPPHINTQKTGFVIISDSLPTPDTICLNACPLGGATGSILRGRLRDSFLPLLSSALFNSNSRYPTSLIFPVYQFIICTYHFIICNMLFAWLRMTTKIWAKLNGTVCLLCSQMLKRLVVPFTGGSFFKTAPPETLRVKYESSIFYTCHRLWQQLVDKDSVEQLNTLVLNCLSKYRYINQVESNTLFI